eukprot:m51a1_g6804 putative pleckstrin domain-containing protein (993) ;mRNA; r:243990-249659
MDPQEESAEQHPDIEITRVDPAGPDPPDGAAPAAEEEQEGDEEPINHRKKLAMEVVETEKTYIAMLTEMVELYVRPLRKAVEAGSPIVNADTISVIFSNVEQIIGINTDLLNMLEERLKDWDDSKRLGDIFLLLAPHFKVYTTYCANYTKALVRLTDRSNKASFAAFLKRAAEMSQYPNLPCYLILPVQRLPRYQLLLDNLRKHTPEDHPDFTDINDALSIITEVNVSINESIRDRQELEKLIALQKQFTGYCPPLYEPKRVLKKEGVLTKVCRKTPKMRYFFLFSDIVVYGTKIEAAGMASTYMFHRLIPLRGAFVKDVRDRAKTQFAFQILAKEKSFTVCAKDSADKHEWIAAFKGVLAELDRAELGCSGGSQRYTLRPMETIRGMPTADDDDFAAAPVWVPDTESGTCMRCPSKFTFVNRRHHCRQCGIIVCGRCSSSKFVLPNLKQLVRVCDSCFDELMDKGGGPEKVPKSNYVRGSKYGTIKSALQDDSPDHSPSRPHIQRTAVLDRSISELSMALKQGRHLRMETTTALPLPKRAPPVRPASDGESSSSDYDDVVEDDTEYDEDSVTEHSEQQMSPTVTRNAPAHSEQQKSSSPAQPPLVRQSYRPRTDIPESYESPYTTPVQNQGDCGSCWAFSALGVVEAAWKKATGTTEHFAPQMLVDCNLGGTCDGGWPNTALDYLVKYTKQGGGAMRESDYAYTGVDGTCKYKASKGVGKIESYFSVTFNEATGGIDASLMKYGPLSICLGANSLDSYQSGILADSSLCRQEVNHAVLLTGWGVLSGQKYWIVKNSWGASWGESGYFRIVRGKGACLMTQELAYGATSPSSSSSSETDTKSSKQSSSQTCVPTKTCGTRVCGSVNNGCGSMIQCGSCSSGQVCQSDGTCKTVNQLDWSEVPTPTEEYFTQTTFNSNTWLKTSGDSDTDRFMAWNSSSSLASATWTSFSAYTLAQSSGTIGLGMRMGQVENVADGIYFKVVLSSSGSASLYL